MAKAMYRRNGADGTAEWFHYSGNDRTVYITWFKPRYRRERYRLPSDQPTLHALLEGARQFSIPQIVALTTDAVGFSADTLKIDLQSDLPRWHQVVDRLLELRDIEPEAAGLLPRRPRVGVPRGDLVPQTRLRRFYETLRMLDDSDLRGRIASYLADPHRVSRLDGMFAESVAHFRRYSNEAEPFQERSDADWFAAYDSIPDQFARCLVSRLRPSENRSHAVSSLSSCMVRAIDYEISSFRTTGGACFEDGQPGSTGAGGIDLLLRNEVSGLPVIGEIKAPGDADFFLALVQALTYAVEMTTPSQAERLKRVYPPFHDLPSGPTGCGCEILLLYSREDSPRLLEVTQRLAEGVLKLKGGGVAARVKSIAFVAAEFLPGGVSLHCTSVVPAPDWSTGG